MGPLFLQDRFFSLVRGLQGPGVVEINGIFVWGLFMLL
jgi:hypothetical protein